MVDKLTGYLMSRIFVKGWQGSFTVHVTDGVPRKIEVHEHKQVEGL